MAKKKYDPHVKKLPSVCLIIPPSAFLLDERVFMNLGILKIASVLEKSGYALEVLDLSGIENYEDALFDHCRKSPTRIFGITSTTPQMPATVKIANKIKENLPDTRVILGGPHVTLVHTAYKKEQANKKNGRASRAFNNLCSIFDVLVSGDGEEAIFRALQEDSPKLVDANDRNSELFLSNRDLEALPYPARHLIDVDSYHYEIDGKRTLSIIAQLGCPFECGFCGGRQSPMLRTIRTRSTKNILSEIRMIYECYGISGFMFYDDELNVNPKMVELMDGISELQKQLGTCFALRGFVKAELFNDRQAEAMKKAGFKWILTGFESGSPRILANINKKATREQNTECIQIARRHGLKVKALMSIGHPGESRETVMETHDWLLRSEPNDLDVTIITTYPGTPYYDFAQQDLSNPRVWIYTNPKNGDKLYSYDVDYNQIADYYKGDPDGGYRSYVFTDNLSPDNLVELRDFVERSIRTNLKIRFNHSTPAIRYEHSMGQLGAALPRHILRKTDWNAS